MSRNLLLKTSPISEISEVDSPGRNSQKNLIRYSSNFIVNLQSIQVYAVVLMHFCYLIKNITKYKEDHIY